MQTFNSCQIVFSDDLNGKKYCPKINTLELYKNSEYESSP